MRFETSDKTSSYGRKPNIKKGYYPAKLLKVEPYADKDGNFIEGKYGHQLIFEFAIYSKDENDTPVSPMMFTEEDKDAVPVKISKFAYHMYKDQKTGVLRTAFTPESAITRLCKSLGWTFVAGEIDLEPFIGNWVEVNVNDYVVTKNDEKYTASTIADVGLYTGKDIPENLTDVNASEKPKVISKQIKHSEIVKKTPAEVKTPKEETKDVSENESEDIKKLNSRIEELHKLHKNKFISDEGHKQAVEQLQAQINSLDK